MNGPAGKTRKIARDGQMDFATLDPSRQARCGLPEVIYAEGKTSAQVLAIARAMIARSGCALVTRALPEHAQALKKAFPHSPTDSRRRTVLVGKAPAVAGTPIPIITAGTSDEAVAEEVEMTCLALGQSTRRINDVGVAGLSRLIQRLDEIQEAAAIICIAGMEGALPSVVGGLVRVPVIAVPTSVGYGASFGGVAALLGMLTSCAPNVCVVNIDDGLGAACIATLIQRQVDDHL